MRKKVNIPPQSTYTVPFDGSFTVAGAANKPSADGGSKKQLEKALKQRVKKISELQKQLYADNRFALLIVFQAMDAAGKDGTIRATMSGVNPAGCRVTSFKAPSTEELDHNFLWRTTKALPERGVIGIFNRSYYEEVLAVRVRPEFLAKQRLPYTDSVNDAANLWEHRFESIREQEEHLARNGTVILKFWLNVSHEEQKQRFLKRLTTPEKYWKFSGSDLSERTRWSDYMHAYEELLNATSRPHAPWFAIPADNKPYMRAQVASIVEQTLSGLPLAWPEKSADELAQFSEHIAALTDQ